MSFDRLRSLFSIFPCQNGAGYLPCALRSAKKVNISSQDCVAALRSKATLNLALLRSRDLGVWFDLPLRIESKWMISGGGSDRSGERFLRLMLSFCFQSSLRKTTSLLDGKTPILHFFEGSSAHLAIHVFLVFLSGQNELSSVRLSAPREAVP